MSAASAHASLPKRPPVTWSPVGSGANFTPALHRKITTIVIHATDGGSLIGNVSWLTNDKAEASSHYVVSRDGTIVQVVPLHDVAWHSGNRGVNVHSIGIEHVGETYDPAGFTAAEYRSSAQLVAWLVRRYDIPIDRTHIIGHADVPDPFHPGLFGGSDHHSDPGPHWKWGYYLRLVRTLAFPNSLEVTTTSLEQGEAVRGIVPWHIALKGGSASKVDFLVDGKLMWSDSRKPFAFAGGRGLNTTTLANGAHVLTVRASGKGGHAAQRTIVQVANHVFALTTSAVRPWMVVKGTLKVRANAWGASATGIGLYVDGHVISRDRKAPYTLYWNSRRVKNGAHALALVAESADGRLARRSLTVVVRNGVARKAAPVPAPAAKKKATAPPRIVSETVADGQTVSGVVDWRAHTLGPVARVEFVVDGTTIAKPTTEPWQATWDATALTGAHVLEVRAYTLDGQVASRKATVTVTPAPTAP
jgi:N-acetyl-anhydromuramyl-L-alanine amidase AmpD